MPKAGSFTWLALRKRILTSDKSAKINIVEQFKCVLCESEFEIVDHLFIHYPVALQCWNFIMEKLNFFTPITNSLWEWFQAWPILYNIALFSCSWRVTLVMVVWSIWWEQNKWIFRKEAMPIEKVQELIDKSISEIMNSFVQKHKHCSSSFTSWDDFIMKIWVSIVIPLNGSLHLPFKNKIDRTQIKWHPPLG